MGNRNRIWAIVGAGIMTLGIATVAFADTLQVSDQGIVAGWDSGTPFAEDAEGDPLTINPEECADLDVDEGEIVFRFTQSGGGQNGVTPNGGGAAGNLLDVNLNAGDIMIDDVQAGHVANNNVWWLVSVTPSGDEVVVTSATSNVTGGTLHVADICIGAAGQVETQAPSDAPTDAVTQAPSSGVTQAPSFEQSQEGEVEPTEPDTSTLGGDVGGPGDAAWLLVVALGVLLATIVVLTPARAGSRR